MAQPLAAEMGRAGAEFTRSFHTPETQKSKDNSPWANLGCEYTVVLKNCQNIKQNKGVQPTKDSGSCDLVGCQVLPAPGLLLFIYFLSIADNCACPSFHPCSLEPFSPLLFLFLLCTLPLYNASILSSLFAFWLKHLSS